MKPISLLSALLLLTPFLGGAEGMALAGPPAPGGGTDHLRVMFVLDKSGSMAEKERWTTLTAAMTVALAILPDTSNVGVILFNHEPSELIRGSLLDDGLRKRIVETCAATKPDGGTRIIDAARKAIQAIDGRGTIVLLSDGAETDNDGNTVPESQWGAEVAELSAQAKNKGIRIVTMALGKDADPAMLRAFARRTEGQFFEVLASAGLVTRFVDVAAQLGSFWQRTEPGEIAGSEDEIVISVTNQNAGHVLFDARTRKPVAPQLELERSGVMARRYVLRGGQRYLFDPNQPATLLRRMVIDWKLPLVNEIPAGRPVAVTMRAQAKNSADLAGLEVVAADPKIRAPCGPDGKFVLEFKSSAKVGTHSCDLEARQAGWRYFLGRWRFQLKQPKPVTVTLSNTNPTTFTTWGNVREVTVEVEATCSNPELGWKLQIEAPPECKVTPTDVLLAEAKTKFRLLVRRTSAPTPENATIAGLLRFRLHGNDIVPPRLEGGELPLSWTHRFPRLKITGMPSTTETIPRGQEHFFPVRVKGLELDVLPSQTTVGVELNQLDVPAGFEVSFATGKDRKATQRLGAGPAWLRVVVAKDILPGRYTMALAPRSTYPGVPLDGAGKMRLSVLIPAVALSIELPTKTWVVPVPINEQRCSLPLTVRARDGGRLPPIEVTVGTTGPAATQVHLRQKSAEKLECALELCIRGQTAAFQSHIKVIAAGQEDAVLEQSEQVDVLLPPVILAVAPEPLILPHFRGWREAAFGWLRGSKPPRVHLRVANPTSWRVAGGRWTVVSAGAEPGADWIGDPATSSPARPGDGILLEAAYTHTTWQPAQRFVLAGVQEEVDLPLWISAAALALLGGGALLTIAVVRGFRIRLRGSTFGVVTGFGRLGLGPLVGERELAAEIRKSPRGCWLCRSCRDRSGLRVAVLTGQGYRTKVAPGLTIVLGPGDQIQLEGDTLSETVSVLLRGRRRPRDLEVGEAPPREAPGYADQDHLQVG